MDVQCPKCGGEYSLDEALVAAAGTAVRCTQCDQVFKVFRPSSAQGDRDEWFVRKAGQTEVIRFERLGVLQQWIGSGKIGRDDLMSRGDDVWKRLGDIPEMRALFKPETKPKAGIASAGEKSTLPPPPMVRSPSGLGESERVQTPLKEPSAIPHEQELDFSSVPPEAVPEKWHRGEAPVVDDPAWAGREDSVTIRHEPVSGLLPPPRPKVGRWIALGMILLLGGVGVYLGVSGIEGITQFVNRVLLSSDEQRYQKFYARGRESFLLDSEVPHYRQADVEFQKVLALKEDHGLAMAALAELHATWAQSLRDTEIDALSDAAANGNSPDSRKVDWLHREYEMRLLEASRWADQAKSVAPDQPETRRALADVLRLRGRLEEAAAVLADAKQPLDPETRYVKLLIAMDSGQPPDSLLEGLSDILSETVLLRVVYRKARVLAFLGREEEARATLSKLFELNPDHLKGRDLLSRLEAKQPILLGPGQDQPDTAAQAETAGAAAAAGGPAEDERAAKGPSPEPDQKETPQKTGRIAPQQAAVDKPSSRSAGGSQSPLMQAVGLQRAGRCADAIVLFEQVLEQTPGNLDAICGLAACHRDRGASGQAITLYRRALGMNPVFGPALYGLADAFKAQGQNEQALKYFRQYLASNPSGREAEAARRAIDDLSVRAATSKASGLSQEDSPSPNEPASGGSSSTSGASESPKEASPPSHEPAPGPTGDVEE
jgi:predicted Zn finger-like uncharacterized protein